MCVMVPLSSSGSLEDLDPTLTHHLEDNNSVYNLDIDIQQLENSKLHVCDLNYVYDN